MYVCMEKIINDNDEDIFINKKCFYKKSEEQTQEIKHCSDAVHKNYK